jgi:prolycopene isomerase
VNEKYDMIVIGAGLGGLSAAARLSRLGKRVLVLEHHSVPGGYAHEFRRGKFRFDVALHALDGMAPGGWGYDALKQTGILNRLCLHRLDPFYTYRTPERGITVHADFMQYESELINHFPHAASGIRALFDASLRAFLQTRRLMQDRAAQRIPDELIPSRYGDALTVMSQSLAEFMAPFIDDPAVLGAFTALWGYYGLPPSQLNAATFVLPWGSYHLAGAYYPQGGGQALSRALEAVIKENGGEIRYQQTVTKIFVSNERATGVETDKGLRADADIIIANSNAPDTFLKLIGREQLPLAFVENLRTLTPSLACAVLYLGVERDLVKAGWNYHEMYVSETNDPEADYANVLRGDWVRAPIGISNYSAADNPAPEGCSVLSVFTLAPMDYQNQWGTGGDFRKYGKNENYLHLKRNVAEILLARTEEFIPGLRGAIKYQEMSTPLTNIRYSLNPGGAIYGFAQSVEQSYAGRLAQQTPLQNLFLAGAWTFPGGGMSAAMLSGVEAARLAIAHLENKSVTTMFMPTEFGQAEEIMSETTPTPKNNGNGNRRQPQSLGSAPAFTLDAVATTRKVTLNEFAGKPVALIFNTADSAEQANALNNALRAQYPDYRVLPILTVVDLRSVPKLFRSVARNAMQ